MNDPRYAFSTAFSSQIIIFDKDDRILLGKRPDTWEWAPGRWGLIGGKVYETETLEDAIKRKTQQEIGFEMTPDGLYQIKQIIIEGRQVLMFFYISEYKGQNIDGELAEYRWFSNKDIQNMPGENFSEFFYKGMFLDFLSGEKNVFPISKIQSLNYIDLGENKDYKEWFEGIINKNYNPDVIPDYKKWKNRTKK